MKHINYQSRYHTGMSIVELMIGMTLGIFLCGIFLRIYVGSNQTYKVINTSSNIAENGRFVLDMLAQDIRMSGSVSCGGITAKMANVVTGSTATSGWMYNTALLLQGFEGGVSTFPSAFAADVRSGTDAIIVKYADHSSGLWVTGHNTSTATITLSQNHGLTGSEIMVMDSRDCTQTALFQMHGTSNTNIVQYTTGGSPGNCTVSLSGNFNCSNTTFASAAPYRTGAMLYQFITRAYYVGTGAAGGSTLFRRELTATGATQALELVDGVESLQIQYGVDTNNDNLPDAYQAADVVEANSRWNSLISVRIAIIVSTVEDYTREGLDTNTYDLNGTPSVSTDDYNPVDDHRLRKVFTSVIALRNKAT